jgi:hypothetical protein
MLSTFKNQHSDQTECLSVQMPRLVYVSFSLNLSLSHSHLQQICFGWFRLFDTYSSMTLSLWHYDVDVFCAVERATKRYSNWLSSRDALRCYCCRYLSGCHHYSTYPHFDSLQWCFPLNYCWISGSLSSQWHSYRTTWNSEAIERNRWQSLPLTVMISFVDAPVEWQMSFH